MADISVTASAVKKTSTTVTDRGTAGQAITAGQPVYKNNADNNKLYKTDADLSLAAAECVGIALHGAEADHPLEYATGGDVTFNAVLAAGTIYVCSATAGGIAPSADMDTATTWYATILGVASSTTNLKLAIKPSRAINA